MSADREIAMMTGSLVGTVIAVLAPLLIGYAVARKLNKDREYSDSIRWPIIAGGLISVLMLLGQCSANNRQNGTSSDDVAVEVIDGEATEAFPDQIDPQLLDAYREKLTKDIESQSQGSYGTIKSTIGTKQYGGKTVAIFNAKGSLGPDLTQYIGAINGKQKIVACASMKGERVPACENKVIEVFGEPAVDGTGTR